MKYLSLSEQDQQLLLHLHKHIYLSRDFIDKYIYTDEHEVTVYRKLGKMAKAGYIATFSVPIKAGSGRPSNIYTLAKLGVDTVEQMTGIVHWQDKWSYQPPVWYMHTLNLAEVVKSYEMKAPEKGLVVKEFISEAKAHFKYYEKLESTSKQAESNIIRPDGILVLGPPNSDKNWGIMLEMERSYADRAGTIRKVNQYKKLLDKSDEEKYAKRMKEFDQKVGFEHPISKWMILFIGDNGSMGKRILRQLKETPCDIRLIVAAKDDLLENPFGDDIYRSLKNPDKPTHL